MENKPKDELELNELITMPMLALRGLVLFPQMVLHFEVGREKSVSALNESMKTGQQIFLVAQKDIKIDNPTVNDLYKVGVVAEVRQIL
ncbi:MAG: LON peptidase substrate-binding domain-containing protein, partial [Hydrogenoanaerobacterium sp.]